MEEFFTRSKANEGMELPLTRPDGTKTEHWIRIRGVDSDAYRKANAESRRHLVKIAALETAEEREAAFDELELELKASLVISWSFEKECTPKNVKEFLREAPQIADAIDQMASRRKYFFASGLSSSSDSPEANTN